ncbi:MAG: hypoxanthine phosphoribosyltransferase, partial [Phycisphaerales bacterium]
MHAIDRILLPKDRIAARVAEIGRELAEDLRRSGCDAPGARVVMVPILTGAIVFVADLIRNMDVQMSVRPITVSSYPGTATST